MRSIAEALAQQLNINPDEPVVTLDRPWCETVWYADEYTIGPVRCIGLILLAALRELYPALRVEAPKDGVPATLLTSMAEHHADAVKAWCLEIMHPDYHCLQDADLAHMSAFGGGHTGSVVPQHDGTEWPGHKIVRDLYQGPLATGPQESQDLTPLVRGVLEAEGVDITAPLRLNIKWDYKINPAALSLMLQINDVVKRWPLSILDLKPTPVIRRDEQWLHDFDDLAVRAMTARVAKLTANFLLGLPGRQ